MGDRSLDPATKDQGECLRTNTHDRSLSAHGAYRSLGVAFSITLSQVPKRPQSHDVLSTRCQQALLSPDRTYILICSRSKPEYEEYEVSRLGAPTDFRSMILSPVLIG